MDPIQEFEQTQVKRKIPLLRPGDTVKIHQQVKEGEKERVQVFMGTVTSVHHGFGINGNVTVRKVSAGVGVEKTFPFHLPSVIKIEVMKRGKVRRAKLYFLRRLQEKAARLKEKKLSEETRKQLRFESAEEEQPAAEKAETKETKSEGKTQSEEKKETKEVKQKKDNKN